jgi:aryl-alcohol dehydrogenase-like predicted oxidoreductase
MTAKIAGYADSVATQNFAERMRARYPAFEPDAYRQLTGTDVITSKIGYGSYRVHYESDEHVATLRAAIEAGCNLIDTSSNYTDGGSETLIGNVLGDMISAKDIQRGEIIVVSKVGYLQGQNLDEAVRRADTCEAWEEVVKYMEGCWHCIHPDVLTDQWNRSAERLGLETIDVYLLHNPEYFLSDAQKRASANDLDSVRDTYYDRIYRAFVQMERFVAEGKIRYYGVSSNTFPSSAADFEHTSLNRVYNAAMEAAETVHGNREESHFKVIQLPYNLFEHGALTEVNNQTDGKDATVLEVATALGLGVLVNRPLNAFKENRMYRLAQYSYRSDLDYQATISSAVSALDGVETILRNTLTDWGIFDQVKAAVNLDLFYDIGGKLQGFLPRVQNREHWEQIASQYLIPQIKVYLHQTTESVSDSHLAEWEQAHQEYVGELNKLLSLITGHFNRAASQEVEWIQATLNNHLPADQSALTLSQKSLNFVTSSPGVSVVLNGMKREQYVKEAMGIMSVPDFGPSAGQLVADVEREM